MQRRVVVVGVLALLAVLAVWRCRSDDEELDHATAVTATGKLLVHKIITIGRGSISGMVRDNTGKPIARAKVCASASAAEVAPELIRRPVCVLADSRGGFAIEQLFAARYWVTATARGFEPGAHVEPADGILVLGDGERRAGVDIVLHAGGVELVGTVADIGGGPIANARVSAFSQDLQVDWYDTTETDQRGTYSLWVATGSIWVRASAEGYSESRDEVVVPRANPPRFDISLFPEAILEGKVVDGTGQPVAHARVALESSSRETFSDDDGTFRFDGLAPDRYVLLARAPGGSGRRTALVRLGKTTSDVEIRLYPGFRVSGRVEFPGGKTCAAPSVSLRDPETQTSVQLRRAGSGELYEDGIAAGRYVVRVDCPGYAQRREAPIEVASDRIGLAWTVDAGATIRGRIATTGGEPVPDAPISASIRNSWDGLGSRWTRSARDGTYELRGVNPGTNRLSASEAGGLVEDVDVEVGAGAIVERDLVVDASGGWISGVVVGSAGSPLGGIAIGFEDRSWRAITDATGAFELGPIRYRGKYKLTAFRSERPLVGPDDKQVLAEVDLTPPNRAVVRLTIAVGTLEIAGRVSDESGAVGDAMVKAQLEEGEAGYRNDRTPGVLTGPDGAFVIRNLRAGAYTVQAERAGMDRATAEHVAAGARVELRLAARGSISGKVRRADGTPVTRYRVWAYGKAGLGRREVVVGSDGTYRIDDVGPGAYTLAVDTEVGSGGTKRIELDLAAGEHKVIDVEIEDLAIVTGRVIEVPSNLPLANIEVVSYEPRYEGLERENITDANGRFTVRNIHPATTEIMLVDTTGTHRPGARRLPLALLHATGPHSYETELRLARRRLAPGQQMGALGFECGNKTFPNGARSIAVKAIDPQGPAATSGLEVGDVIAAVDGVELRAETDLFWELIAAPAGTRISLGLARGATVQITLGNR